MTIREYYVQRRKAELPVFLKVLKALPKDKISYKPHENSPSTEDVVWILTNELQVCLDAATKGQGELKSTPPPPLEEMLDTFEKTSNDLTAAVEKLDDGGWNKKIKLLYQGKVAAEQPLGEFLWYIMFDAIHHRGQLAAYLRPMGAKVPSIYGPSADEQGGM